MGRMWAIVEREMRRFRRSPILIAMSMVLPVVQLGCWATRSAATSST